MICSVVPTDDAHASEYVAPCDFRRAFISGWVLLLYTNYVLGDERICHSALTALRVRNPLNRVGPKKLTETT